MTSKPISTISYNTEEFLKVKLDYWYKNHIIQAYQYIKHKGENGDKDHIHLRIEPNKSLDKMVLQEELREFEPGNVLPLGCRPFRPSKEEDFFLYIVHDPQYLKLKYGEDYAAMDGKIPYNYTDIVVSEFYDMQIAWIRAKAYLQHSSSNISKSISEGKKPLDLIMEGENVHTVNAIMHALQGNDYTRLLTQYKKLSMDYETLVIAIKKAGLEIVRDRHDNVEIINHNNLN